MDVSISVVVGTLICAYDSGIARFAKRSGHVVGKYVAAPGSCVIDFWAIGVARHNSYTIHEGVYMVSCISDGSCNVLEYHRHLDRRTRRVGIKRKLVSPGYGDCRSSGVARAAIRNRNGGNSTAGYSSSGCSVHAPAAGDGDRRRSRIASAAVSNRDGTDYVGCDPSGCRCTCAADKLRGVGIAFKKLPNISLRGVRLACSLFKTLLQLA